MNKRHPSDPRPDIKDHAHWNNLLWNCWHTEQPLYYLLHGIRCGGAEIMETENSFMLLPGEWSEVEWTDIKQNRLSQFRDQLINVFKISRAGRYVDGEIPEKFLSEEEKNPVKYAWMR